MIKRPICLVSIGLIFGILGGQYFEKGISPLFFVYALSLIGVAFLMLHRKEKRLLRISKGVCICLLLAIFIGFGYGNWTEKQKYSWNLENQEVGFIGKVVKREVKNGQEKYILEITQLNKKKLFPKIQVQVQCKENGKDLLSYGSKIVGTGTWKEFSKARNEGTFNEREYRKSQGITAKILVEKEKLREIKQKKSWIDTIKEEREKFCAFLENELGETESALAIAIFVRRKEQVK